MAEDGSVAQKSAGGGGRKKKQGTASSRTAGYLGILKNLIFGKKLTKEEKVIKDICKRQKDIEAQEINEEWRVVYGGDPPKKKKDVLVIKDVTLRNIWFEPHFLFNIIKSFKSEECFHPSEKYFLQWLPPGSAFKISIPLNDRALQESALRRFSTMNRFQKATMIFNFVPMIPSIGLFAERVHPSSLVSYRTRNEVMAKLCDLFLDGAIELDDLNSIMASNFDVWKKALYNYLPADEKEFHEYLSHIVDKASSKSIEQKYLDDEITLQEYEDLKYPERKRKKDLETAGYPQPYEFGSCRICGSPKGVIKCKTCDSLVCPSCIYEKFLDPKSLVGSFVLMHRIFCMKFGLIPKTNTAIVQEPTYLREMRATGREAAIEKLIPKVVKVDVVLDESVGSVEDDEEDEEERRKRLEEEAKKDTQQVIDFKEALSHAMKKYLHAKKDLLQCQHQVEEPGHADNYVQRILRLKDEAIQKLSKLSKKFESIREEALKIENCYPPTKQALLDEVSRTIIDIISLVEIKSIEGYESEVQRRNRPPEPEADSAALLLNFT